MRVMSYRYETPFLTIRTTMYTKSTGKGVWYVVAVGKFAVLHPYRKQIASQNYCFDSSKPKSLIGSALSLFDTPLSMLTLSNLLDLSHRLFLN